MANRSILLPHSPSHQQPIPPTDEIQDEPEEIVAVGVDSAGAILFQIRRTSQDNTWQRKEDMMGLKDLVRTFYKRRPKLEMPKEFRGIDVKDVDKDEVS